MCSACGGYQVTAPGELRGKDSDLQHRGAAISKKLLASSPDSAVGLDRGRGDDFQLTNLGIEPLGCPFETDVDMELLVLCAKLNSRIRELRVKQFESKLVG